MNGDGCSLDHWIEWVHRSAGDDRVITAWVVGVDPTGRRRVIWGAWPSRLFDKFDGLEDAGNQAAIASATSLADRFQLEPEVRT